MRGRFADPQLPDPTCESPWRGRSCEGNEFRRRRYPRRKRKAHIVTQDTRRFGTVDVPQRVHSGHQADAARSGPAAAARRKLRRAGSAL
jgi:hypothetical protein